ncbi:uncharacterized protein LOC131163485 [Malania oleifera]|uniref:uncharacterized protein LOC131163485 n=1 Tax=Malania oleifera TaxID=397392 RepID=UPI0025AEC68B|nr:uncharacterized protein LOC131163485 [Malania oleifera]
MEVPLPSKFKMPTFEMYKGSTNPVDHLDTFKVLMQLQGVLDAIMCRAFDATLKGNARAWHNTEECIHLKNEIEALIKRGHLSKFVKKGDRRREFREQKKPNVNEKEEQIVGEIAVIFGGPANDVFAWSAHDMPRIDLAIMEHRLQVDPNHKPVKQKKRSFALEQIKPNGKWRTCIDFMDLNKVRLKDSFPLPLIDQLVDSTSGHELLSFMDVYLGYNQIPMHLGDEEKTSFITKRGLYYYKMMPLGLKNARAIYQ